VVSLKDSRRLMAVGARGWIAVTRDKNIRRKRRQREIVAESQLRLFVLNQCADMTRLDYLELLTRTWRRMLHYSAEIDPPAIVTISQLAEFTQIL
jgi:PIN like domain